MRLPFWFRRLLLWCRLAFEGLTQWKEGLLCEFFKLPVVAPLFRYITPNDLCYLRMFAGVIIIFLYLRGFYSALLPVFAFAIMLDFLDGPLARFSNRVSEDGKVLDANADKVLVLIPLLLIGFDRLNGQLVTWLMVVECFLFLVANYLKPVLRGRYGIPLVSGSNAFGQIKMTIESVAIGIVLYDPTSTTAVQLGQYLIFCSICFGILSLLRHLGRMDRGIHLDPRKRIITWPNVITIGSMFLLIPTGFAIIQEQWYEVGAYLTAILASDGVDGWVARRFHQETAFGTALDPVRDFIVRIFAAVWVFTWLPTVGRAALCGVVTLEIVAALLNVHTAHQFHRASLVNTMGRRRSLGQSVILALLLFHRAGVLKFGSWVVDGLMVLAVVLSFVTLVSYFRQRQQLQKSST